MSTRTRPAGRLNTPIAPETVAKIAEAEAYVRDRLAEIQARIAAHSDVFDEVVWHTALIRVAQATTWASTARRREILTSVRRTLTLAEVRRRTGLTQQRVSELDAGAQSRGRRAAQEQVEDQANG